MESSSEPGTVKSVARSQSDGLRRSPGPTRKFPASAVFSDGLRVDSLLGSKVYNMSTEDAAHSLRKLERDAFKGFVAAVRAQGPLTPYKELLLEHVKYALFIRDHDYIETMQEAVGDEFLRKIAEKLNPSYSCTAQWEALCFPSHTVKNPLIKSLDAAGSIISGEQRAKLFTTIGCHNASVKELDLATAKLANVKKDFYIPQQLRRVLADSELAIGRIDVDMDLTEEELRREYAVYEKERNKTMREIVAEEDAQLAAGKPRRGRKKKVVEAPFLQQTLKAQALYAREQKNPEGEGTSDSEKLPTVEEQDQAEADMFKMIDDCDKIAANIEQERAKTLSPQKPKKPRKSKEGKNIEPSTSIETGKERRVSEEQRSIDEELVLVKTAQAMIEDMVNAGNLKAHENGLTNGDKLISPTPKKRGRKMKEKDKDQVDKQDEGCARTRPFDFGPVRGDDPNKPIRGNPDKRSVKRKERKSMIVATSNGISHSGTADGTAPSNASLLPGNPPTIVIRPRTNSTASNQSVVETSPAKRMRYISDSSNNPAVSGSSTAPSTVPTIFSVRPGRPTTFRPPNVVFPRAASVLTNGARYTVPFSQSSGNPTRPYYGNPGYVNRPPIVGRERPQLHTFTRPPTGSVIRFLEPESKSQESNGPTKQPKSNTGKIPIVIPTTAQADPQKSIAMPLVTTGDLNQPIYQVVGASPIPYMVVPIPMTTTALDDAALTSVGTVESEGTTVDSEKSQEIPAEDVAETRQEMDKMETDSEMSKSNDSNLVERLAEVNAVSMEEIPTQDTVETLESQPMQVDEEMDSTDIHDMVKSIEKRHEENFRERLELQDVHQSDGEPSQDCYLGPQQPLPETSMNAPSQNEVIVNGVDYSASNAAYSQYTQIPMNLNNWCNPPESHPEIKSDEKPIPVPTQIFSPPTSDTQPDPSESKD